MNHSGAGVGVLVLQQTIITIPNHTRESVCDCPPSLAVLPQDISWQAVSGTQTLNVKCDEELIQPSASKNVI